MLLSKKRPGILFYIFFSFFLATFLLTDLPTSLAAGEKNMSYSVNGALYDLSGYWGGKLYTGEAVRPYWGYVSANQTLGFSSDPTMLKTGSAVNLLVTDGEITFRTGGGLLEEKTSFGNWTDVAYGCNSGAHYAGIPAANDAYDFKVCLMHPEFNLISSDTAKITCSENVCIPVSPGQASITVSNKSNISVYGALSSVNDGNVNNFTTLTPKSLIWNVTIYDPPNISNFISSKSEVNPGETVTLTFQAEKSASCTASGGPWSGTWNDDNSDEIISGSASSNPINASSIFTLSCTGSGGEVDRSVSVTVKSELEQPLVNLISSKKFPLPGETFNLTWTSERATECLGKGWLDPAWIGPQPTSNLDGVVVGPLEYREEKYVYTLECSGPGGTFPAHVEIFVQNPDLYPDPEIVSFLPSSSTVGFKGSTDLIWEAKNAVRCEASGDWTGDKSSTTGAESTGSLSEARAYSFTLTCYGEGDSIPADKTVIVTVNPQIEPVANLYFEYPTSGTTVQYADDVSVPYNSSVRIRWNSQNAKNCWISDTSFSGIGGSFSNSYTLSKTYTLTCESVDGSTDTDVGTIYVEPRPMEIEFAAKKYALLQNTNDSTFLYWRTIAGNGQITCRLYNANSPDIILRQRTSFSGTDIVSQYDVSGLPSSTLFILSCDDESNLEPVVKSILISVLGVLPDVSEDFMHFWSTKADGTPMLLENEDVPGVYMVDYKEDIKMNWEAATASSCIATSNYSWVWGGSKNTGTGSQLISDLTYPTYNFYLTCSTSSDHPTNPNASETELIVIKVRQPLAPTILNLRSNKPAYMLGESIIIDWTVNFNNLDNNGACQISYYSNLDGGWKTYPVTETADTNNDFHYETAVGDTPVTNISGVASFNINCQNNDKGASKNLSVGINAPIEDPIINLFKVEPDAISRAVAIRENQFRAAITWDTSFATSCNLSRVSTATGQESTFANGYPAKYSTNWNFNGYPASGDLIFVLKCYGPDGRSATAADTLRFVDGDVSYINFWSDSTLGGSTIVPYNTPTTLRWEVIGIKGPYSCIGELGTDDWRSTSLGQSGSYETERVRADRLYRISCKDKDGISVPSQNLNVIVGPQGATEPQISFWADGYIANSSGKATLGWKVVGAESCQASGSTDWSGNVDINGGSKTVGSIVGNISRTYVLTCAGPSGNRSAFVTIFPQGSNTPLPVIDFWADESSNITVGGGTVVRWNARNVNTCTASATMKNEKGVSFIWSDWSGEKLLTGAMTTSNMPYGIYTLQLECKNIFTGDSVTGVLDLYVGLLSRGLNIGFTGVGSVGSVGEGFQSASLYIDNKTYMIPYSNPTSRFLKFGWYASQSIGCRLLVNGTEVTILDGNAGSIDLSLIGEGGVAINQGSMLTVSCIDELGGVGSANLLLGVYRFEVCGNPDNELYVGQIKNVKASYAESVGSIDPGTGLYTLGQDISSLSYSCLGSSGEDDVTSSTDFSSSDNSIGIVNNAAKTMEGISGGNSFDLIGLYDTGFANISALKNIHISSQSQCYRCGSGSCEEFTKMGECSSMLGEFISSPEGLSACNASCGGEYETYKYREIQPQ